MKKKLLAFLLLSALFIVPAAASIITPYWTYTSLVVYDVRKASSQIDWSASISAYPLSNVTDVRVTAKLQRQVATGWTTLDTKTIKEAGAFTGFISTYANWLSNQSYRIEVYGYVYNGSTIIETVGPLYDYLNT